MQFHGLTALLLSLFVACVCAQSVTSTTTFTSTSTHTRTMTVSEVVASVTSTYSTYSTHNTTAIAPTGSVGTIIASTTSRIGSPSSSPLPTNFSGAASNVQASYGVMGLFIMAVAALL
ncbi:hypothetical protein BOTCAL_0009g00510 [Botryotinia calthae]|uniref:REJ domain-containing protein n=1 Tax=Botryotinia calthae TaxID=38488 RepID=A0A4Y8DH36_9HELO|nr:hypothetical protein BOTCAL_0009g00510 [Botryotinia calthae]